MPLIAKPGYITGAGGMMRGVFGAAMSITGLVPTIDMKEACAALLDMALGKTEGDTILNNDLSKIGKEALKREGIGS